MLACKYNLPSCSHYSSCGPLRFVDRDMFMQYTPYGIGHPTILWEITRDSANADLADSSESEGNDNRDSDIHSCEGDSEKGGGDEDHEGGEVEDELDDEDELEDEDKAANEQVEGGDEDEVSGVNDPDDWEMEDIEDEGDDYIFF